MITTPTNFHFRDVPWASAFLARLLCMCIAVQLQQDSGPLGMDDIACDPEGVTGLFIFLYFPSLLSSAFRCCFPALYMPPLAYRHILCILRCALRRSCGVLRVRVLWPAVPRAPVATTCHESVDFPCTGILPS